MICRKAKGKREEKRGERKHGRKDGMEIYKVERRGSRRREEGRKIT